MASNRNKYKDIIIKQNCGLDAWAVERLGYNEKYLFMFEDGRTCIGLSTGFEKGLLSPEPVTVGEIVVQSNGLVLECLEILDNNKVKIRDQYNNIRKVLSITFRGDNVTKKDSDYSIGTKVYQKCGMYAKIIEYNGGRQIKVLFDNGVVKTVEKDKFMKGALSSTIRDVNWSKVGDKVYQKCGMYAELLEIVDKDTYRVRFDNGDIRDINRKSFKSGSISKTTKTGKNHYRVGERVKQNCGEYAEVIKLLPNKRCIVKFASGVKRECYCSAFRNGSVSSNPLNKVYVRGSVHTNELGMVFEVIHGGSQYMNVRFEDGSTARVLRKSIIPEYCERIKRSREFRIRYKRTNEEILSVYFDKELGKYVGVLLRCGGLRYIRVL